MIEYVDECVGCPPEMGCLGSSCPNRNIPCLICDICGEMVDSEDCLYECGGDQLCLDCLLDQFPKIRIGDI